MTRALMMRSCRVQGEASRVPSTDGASSGPQMLARTLAGARTYGWLLAGLYAVLFVYGLIAVGQDWDFLNVNAGDNVLHILAAVVGLVIALLPVRSAVDAGHRR